ncbi:PIG-L deacetylase family protein [Rhodococcus sp. BP22]|uniref:PIG-L deacetylase family protein n=1 Tax=Rhodococcus sp. BP22 TaxID=2758566 RepID=UPI00164418EA|nr:PIG-L deacetylase family protein [Rhodococcus sp. BP22]
MTADSTPDPHSYSSDAVSDSDVERVLVLAAHPDDVDFGAAGTVALWTERGIVVSYCLATSGDAGGFEDIPREAMAAMREAEQQAAAAALGVHDVEFLRFADGALYPTMELRKGFSRAIRRVRPQRVLIQSPEFDWSRVGASHPDHRAAGEAAFAAVYPDARNPYAHPELLEDEGLQAWSAHQLWIMGGPHNNMTVDITATFDSKVAALRAHRSQTEHIHELDALLRGFAGAAASQAGLPEGRLAEAFQVVAVT